MPFLEDGTHLDVVLNPWVPSRMNADQMPGSFRNGNGDVKWRNLYSNSVFDGASEEELKIVEKQGFKNGK